MDLSTATFEELATEIEKRFPSVAILYDAPLKTTNAATEAHYRYSGTLASTLGLLLQMQYALLTQKSCSAL